MATIPLTKGAVALVDETDVEMLSRTRWHLHSGGYAARTESRGGKRHMVLMHRQILAAPMSLEVDHVNGNRLDNRRTNLRLCTHAQNMGNKHTRPGKLYRGVHWPGAGKLFYATIGRDGSKVRLGGFPTPEEAARAYDAAAWEQFGEFAILNFPHEIAQQAVGRTTEQEAADRAA